MTLFNRQMYIKNGNRRKGLATATTLVQSLLGTSKGLSAKTTEKKEKKTQLQFKYHVLSSKVKGKTYQQLSIEIILSASLVFSEIN